MNKTAIPRKVVYRLSQYLRILEKLQANAVATVSSAALAKAAGVTSAQLRRDFTHFGQFGKRGLGYPVGTLVEKLGEVLGTAHLQPVALVGVGNLGAALLHYDGFAREGFEIVCAFDSDPSKCGKNSPPLRVQPMARLKQVVRRRKVRVAILCVPGAVAQDVANRLVESNVQAILNFAPVLLQVPGHVVVNNVDLALELESLSYFTR